MLYPDDSTLLGRELRLRQEYFFVSASLQDIVRRYQVNHQDFDALPDKVSIHLCQRALPLIHMMEWTLKEGGFILWEASGDF